MAVGWAGFGFWIALPLFQLKPIGLDLWLLCTLLRDGPDLDSGLPCPCCSIKPIGFGLWFAQLLRDGPDWIPLALPLPQLNDPLALASGLL
jgi:hypothetical protein